MDNLIHFFIFILVERHYISKTLEETNYKDEEDKALHGSLNQSSIELREAFLFLLEIHLKDESFISLNMRSLEGRFIENVTPCFYSSINDIWQ